MQQDELARLFSAHMNLSQAPPQPIPNPPEQQVPEEQSAQQNQQQAHQPIIYASQHYTHTYHIAPTYAVPQEPANTQIQASELESILLRNSIDPTLLFPSQIDLFQNADDDQRLRLLELWRISPPQRKPSHPGGVDYNISRRLYDWPPTSLAQEEAMAKLRYEAAQEEWIQREEIQNHQQQLDQSMDDGPELTVLQGTRDILAASPDPNAEPYIVSGYDMLAKREYEESAKAAANPLMESTKYNQATDPVYNYTDNSGGLWDKNIGSMLDMENQYGAFAFARDHDIRPVYVDDEMIM